MSQCQVMGCEWPAVGQCVDSPRCICHMPTDYFYVYEKDKPLVERINKLKEEWKNRRGY